VGAARKAAGLGSSGYIEDADRQDIIEELNIPEDDSPTLAGTTAQYEINAAAMAVDQELLVTRNPEGKIIAVASFYQPDLRTLYISHIGSTQAGEGASILHRLEQFAMDHHKTKIEIYAADDAIEWWKSKGFSMNGVFGTKNLRRF
jgi:hypothetical protein